MASSGNQNEPPCSVIVIHNGERRQFSVPSQRQLARLGADGGPGSAAFLQTVVEAFGVSAAKYQLQHYRSKARLLSDEQLRRVAVGSQAAGGGETLVCNLVRKSGHSDSSAMANRSTEQLSSHTGSGSKLDGPRRVHIQRKEPGGFGFTLRYFVVHPPANVQSGRVEPMDTIFVKQVVSGGAGEAAGLRVGDRLEKVNDISVAGKSYQDVIDMIKSSGKTIVLLVTPSEDDHIQQAFRSDAYGKDGENVVRRTLAQTQDFNSGSSHMENSSPLGAEHSFLRTGIRNNKVSPSLNQHRRGRSVGSSASSGSQTQTPAQDLLQSLQTQQHTSGHTKSGSQSSLSGGAEDAQSPGQRKKHSTSSWGGYEPSFATRSMENLDDGRHGQASEGHSSLKTMRKENGYSPLTQHKQSHSANTTLVRDSIAHGYLPGSVDDPYARDQGGTQAFASETQLIANDKSPAMHHSSIRSTDIPEFLKGPKVSQSRTEQRSDGVEKSKSMENLGGSGDPAPKSASLPHAVSRTTSDWVTTESESRHQPVAQSHSVNDFTRQQGDLTRTSSGGYISSPSPPVFDKAASQEEEEWRQRMQLDNPVTTITATYALESRNKRRTAADHRQHVASDPPWVRTRNTSANLKSTPITATHQPKESTGMSYSAMSHGPDPGYRTSLKQLAKSTSLPRDTTPPVSRSKRIQREKQRQQGSVLTSLSVPHDLTLAGNDSDNDIDCGDQEDIDDENLAGEDVLSPRSRLSLSAPSSPVLGHKAKLRPKSDIEDDEGDGKTRDRRISWLKRRSSTKLGSQKFHGSGHIPTSTELHCTAAACLYKKQVLLPGGKKAYDRSWRSVFAILQHSAITFYKDESEVSVDHGSLEVSDQTVDINGCIVDIAHDYRKRQNVFRLLTADGAEYLLQAEDFQTSVAWIKDIRSAADDSRELPSQTLILEHLAKHSTSAEKADSDAEDTAKPLTRAQRLAPSPGILRKKRNFFGRRKNSLAAGDKTFGVPLGFCPRSAELTLIPMIIEKCLSAVEARGMDTVGIYRVPGTKLAIDNLVKEVDLRLAELDFCDGNKPDDINVISSMVKQFFRQLPDSLLTFALYSSMVRASRISDPAERRAQLQVLISEMPAINFNTLHYLLRHLRRVSNNSKENKMEVKNLAIVFGPTLVRAANDDTNLMVTDMGEQCRIVETLLNHVDDFFPPEGDYNYRPALAVSPTFELPADTSSPQSMEPEVDRTGSASPPSEESKLPPPHDAVEHSPSPIPHAPAFIPRPQQHPTHSAETQDEAVPEPASVPVHIPVKPVHQPSQASLAATNKNIRARDVYNVTSEPPPEPDIMTEKPSLKSREASRAEVALVKQEVVTRWVALHQWGDSDRHEDDSRIDDSPWVHSPEPLDPEQEAQAAKVMQRGIRRSSVRGDRGGDEEEEDVEEEEYEAQPAAWHEGGVQPNVVHAGEDHGLNVASTQIRQPMSDSQRVRPRHLADAGQANRTSYYRAVNEGAVNMPQGRQQTDGVASRKSFPESPLDYVTVHQSDKLPGKVLSGGDWRHQPANERLTREAYLQQQQQAAVAVSSHNPPMRQSPQRTMPTHSSPGFLPSHHRQQYHHKRGLPLGTDEPQATIL